METDLGCTGRDGYAGLHSRCGTYHSALFGVPQIVLARYRSLGNESVAGILLGFWYGFILPLPQVILRRSVMSSCATTCKPSESRFGSLPKHLVYIKQQLTVSFADESRKTRMQRRHPKCQHPSELPSLRLRRSSALKRCDGRAKLVIRSYSLGTAILRV